MRKFLVFVFVAVLFAMPMAASADSILQTKLKPYQPGQQVELVVKVKGDNKNVTPFGISIEYGGTWWAGGSGPAQGINAEQFYMGCQIVCAEWWRGDIPPKQDAVITIPLTTNPSWSGTFPAGINIWGNIDGVDVEYSVDVKTK